MPSISCWLDWGRNVNTNRSKLQIFLKFVSGRDSGTGVGVYISKNIIEAHGGRIWAENSRDSEGATFSF